MSAIKQIRSWHCSSGSGHSKATVLPGLKLRFNYIQTLSMKAEDAYISALSSIYGLASPADGWEGIIPNGHSAVSKAYKGVNLVFGSVAPEGDRYQLQYKHVIIGILETLNMLAGKNDFYYTHTDLLLHGRYVGNLAIGPRAADVNVVNLTLGDSGSNSNTLTSRNLLSKGTIVSPEDSNFVISYERFRDSIPCQDLLNSALNGMASSAVFADDHMCTDFAGLDLSGRVVFRISGRHPETTRYRLDYEMARTVLELLPKRLYENQKCGEVTFTCKYGGMIVGGGSIMLD